MRQPKAPATHEDLHRAVDVRPSSDRSFGLVFAAVFALLGALPLLSGGQIRWWALAVGGGFAAVAGARPSALGPLNRAWLRVGLRLGAATSPVILGALFYGVVTPIGLVMRWRGSDLLRLRPEPGRDSYWIRRTPPGPAPETMSNQFWTLRRAKDTMGAFVREFWMFVRVRKKFWLLPILILLALFGGLIVLTQGSAVAPFIYTLF
jgi:Family of unknown function (DUF5989)/Saxitoxin biosynthesis operon protein SxtJ